MDGRGRIQPPRSGTYHFEAEFKGDDSFSYTKGQMGEPLELPEGAREQERSPAGLCAPGNQGGDWYLTGGYPDLELGTYRRDLQYPQENQEGPGWDKESASISSEGQDESPGHPVEGAHYVQVGEQETVLHTSTCGAVRSYEFTTGFVMGGIITYAVIAFTEILFPCF